ncbi:hypothetical protein N894_1175 [Francisella tularensis subsp. novicida PA10-7858]|nr:hypothetical protein N894_1175 [Francisella tularensis subsp. novicida PA10-7858]
MRQIILIFVIAMQFCFAVSYASTAVSLNINNIGCYQNREVITLFHQGIIITTKER